MVLEMEGGQSRIQGRANGGSGLHEHVQKYKRAMYLRPRWNQVTRTESRVAYPSYASVASERASERGWSPSGLVITNPTMHGPLSYQKAEMPPLGSLPARL